MPAQSLTETYTGSVVDWYVPNHTAGTLRVTCRGPDGIRGGSHPNWAAFKAWVARYYGSAVA